MFLIAFSPTLTPGKVEVINAREMVPASHDPGLLDQCEHTQPLGTGEAPGRWDPHWH